MSDSEIGGEPAIKGGSLPETFFIYTIPRVRTITQIPTVQNTSKPKISTEQESQENLEK